MVWSDTHLLNQFQLLEIVFNYVTIAGIPKQEFQQVEGGDTDVGGVTVIFAVRVTHGGEGEAGGGTGDLPGPDTGGGVLRE